MSDTKLLVGTRFPVIVSKDGKPYRVQQLNFNHDGALINVRLFDPSNNENSFVVSGRALDELEVLSKQETVYTRTVTAYLFK